MASRSKSGESSSWTSVELAFVAHVVSRGKSAIGDLPVVASIGGAIEACAQAHEEEPTR